MLSWTLSHNSSSTISLAEALVVVGAAVVAVAMVQSGTYLVEVVPDQALILPALPQGARTAAFLEFKLTGIPIFEHARGVTKLAGSKLMMNLRQQFAHATHDTRFPGTLIDQATH